MSIIFDMKCPNCDSVLEAKTYKGIEINECPKCGGMWFDAKEIDQLEDTVFDQDDFKNTMVTNVRPSERKCPVCATLMKKFNYRWEDLELELCPNNHGFWLDKGEEKRVTELMEKYENDLERKYKAEEEWSNHLKHLQSPSFFDKIKDILQ